MELIQRSLYLLDCPQKVGARQMTLVSWGGSRDELGRALLFTSQPTYCF
jgi:hypothetical protein